MAGLLKRFKVEMFIATAIIVLSPGIARGGVYSIPFASFS